MKDRRENPKVREFSEKHRLATTPLIGASDLDDLTRVVDALPPLDFPIDSTGELIDKLGGTTATLDAAGVPLRVGLLVKRLTARDFPISSMENFVEKIAELLRKNRVRYDIPKELKRIHGSIGRLAFPIENHADLVRRAGEMKQVTIEGRKMDAKEAVRFIPDHAFPIKSKEDFDNKVTLIIQSRPIVTLD